MLASAMPISKNRSGNFLAKISDLVDLARSASRATISGCSAPSRASDSPNACRVALPAALLIVVSLAFLAQELAERHQLVESPLGLLGLGRDAVPLDLVLHERDALALDG